MGHTVTGKDSQPQPSHGNHMQHFENALKDALNNWQWNETATLTFEVVISPNPGGIRDYHVTLSS